MVSRVVCVVGAWVSHALAPETTGLSLTDASGTTVTREPAVVAAPS